MICDYFLSGQMREQLCVCVCSGGSGEDDDQIIKELKQNKTISKLWPNGFNDPVAQMVVQQLS